ncbi:MAG: porin [Candidatus Pelagibacter bacterium]|nr:porin [Candidatus Pelagibacter bacterium]
MTNIKKLGLSALAGSLVAVSAQAGEISVTGSANVTYVTGKDAAAGKSIGTDKDVAFTGTGELDNGWTFTVSTLLTDAQTVSSSYTSLTMGSLGTVSFGTDTGGANYKYDEEVPQAYEQMSDAQNNSANRIGNMADTNMIVYNSPSFDLGGVTASFDLEYSPNANATGSNDGGSASLDNDFGSATGAGVTLSYDTLKFGIYGAEIDRTTPGTNAQNDAFEGAWYVNYSFGPVAIGYTESYMDGGANGTPEDVNSAKDVGSNTRTANGFFEGNQMSIAFNVNENFSVSYTESEETYDAQDNAATAVADVTMKTDGIQAAYSMGAMSIKAYKIDVTNPAFDEDAADKTATEIALGLAF